jgi:hypothetical protein
MAMRATPSVKTRSRFVVLVLVVTVILGLRE